MVGSYGAAIPFQGGTYGIGVLSKTKPVRSYQVALPGREEARTLLVCEFDDFVFFCTHLSLTAADQKTAAGIINHEKNRFGNKPVFLAGDFNADPNSETVRLLEKSWKRLSPLLLTFPANRPNRTIDYIFVSSDASFDVSEARVIDESAASDHRPVLVDLRKKQR